MTTPDDLDRADMERLVKGSDAVLNSLMDRHAEKLFHYLIRQLGNEQDAEDLAQEAFVKVYQHRSRFDPRQKFTTWLYSIATNLCRDRLRYRARHPQVPLERDLETDASLGERLPLAGGTPSEQLEQQETAEAVRRAIATLPEELRTSLVLSEYEGFSHGEIGSMLNCTAKAVETRLYRARKELRLRLARALQI